MSESVFTKRRFAVPTGVSIKLAEDRSVFAPTRGQRFKLASGDASSPSLPAAAAAAVPTIAAPPSSLPVPSLPIAVAPTLPAVAPPTQVQSTSPFDLFNSLPSLPIQIIPNTTIPQPKAAPSTAPSLPVPAPSLPVSEAPTVLPPPVSEAPAAAALKEDDKLIKQIDAEVAPIKARYMGKTFSEATRFGVAPPPAGVPQLSTDTFLTSDIKKTLQSNPDTEIKKPDRGIYRPISSGDFRTFITSTYQNHSLQTLLTLADGRAPVKAEKTLDQDACKKRDPNKVELFYYQKFIRDYLSKGTPYRGSLVYHGLGSGKTCTSIAAAEALYWGGLKQIWVLTPATLSNNYRKDLARCGYFPLRIKNYWQFMPVDASFKTESPANRVLRLWLLRTMGLPEDIIYQQGGAWIPDPTRESNWTSLSADAQASIQTQITAHMNHRFKFIHYNGVTSGQLALLAFSQKLKGRGLFDDSVIIIDEVHNLVRTINGTKVGSKSIPSFIKAEEPISYNWNMEKSSKLAYPQTGHYKYPRGYTLYRLLQDAVNTKVVALSATPMINYPQEFAILMNMIGGQQRTVEIALTTMVRGSDKDTLLRNWLKEHPKIDFYAIEEIEKRPVLTLTPVPYGFKKVVAPGADYKMRGFVADKGDGVASVDKSRVGSQRSCERNMEEWAKSLLEELMHNGIFMSQPVFKTPAYSLIMDLDKEFVANFINRATLEIKNANILKARATGLTSYYRGGSEELMPRAVNEEVRVPMSDHMFTKYIEIRDEELEGEKGRTTAQSDMKSPVAARGKTAAEQDLYAQAVKTLQTGFKMRSRAACNFVYPEDMKRPTLSVNEVELMLKQEEAIIADQEVDLTPATHDRIPIMRGGVGSEDDEEVGAAAGGVGPIDADEGPIVQGEGALMPDEAAAVAQPIEVLDASITSAIDLFMKELENPAKGYLTTYLSQYSPKYAAILERIRVSPGPALVYSQFKTLEGLGIFAAVLRSAPEQFIRLTLTKHPATGDWIISNDVIQAHAANPHRPRYVLYTGDQDLDQRRVLLQIYNADFANMNTYLAAQCQWLNGGAADNRTGSLVRVFMITQSGAEGISLFNTRQVHVMEPYWNNVRIEQVIGRAIRLCSHMNLPWDDRVVNVYTYLSVFSDAQKSVNKTTGAVPFVVSIDNFRTTDENLFEIAKLKQTLADGLFEIAQSAASDCALNAYEHADDSGTPTIKCFQYSPTFMYHPDIRRDIINSGTA